MEYRVEELAAAVGVKVDTVRFYQGRGLLPPPRREGRVALYGESHLVRLRRIRELLAGGFTLAQIARLLDRPAARSAPAASEDRPPPGRAGAPPASTDAALLAALVEESVGERSWTRAELAAEAGVPEALILAAQSAGLFEPMQVQGEERFSAADVEMARAALVLLGAGFPLDVLLRLAVEHAARTRELVDAAIDLFDEHVIDAAPDAPQATRTIVEAFRTLLPQTTRLVALHFQRTLLNRALERLRARGAAGEFEDALAATESAQLEVAWKP